MSVYVYPGAGELVPYDYEALAVSTSVVPLTASKLTVSDGQNPPRARRAKSAFVTVETNSVRVRWDGGNPAGGGGAGHLLLAGDSIEFNGETLLTKVKFIRETADASVRVTYSRTA